jgi:hypothetical protein
LDVVAKSSVEVVDMRFHTSEQSLHGGEVSVSPNKLITSIYVPTFCQQRRLTTVTGATYLLLLLCHLTRGLRHTVNGQREDALMKHLQAANTQLTNQP